MTSVDAAPGWDTWHIRNFAQFVEWLKLLPPWPGKPDHERTEWVRLCRRFDPYDDLLNALEDSPKPECREAAALIRDKGRRADILVRLVLKGLEAHVTGEPAKERSDGWTDR